VTRHVLTALQRSLTRRRQAGNLEPLPSIFSRQKQMRAMLRHG
jgi:hypothetical protein